MNNKARYVLSQSFTMFNQLMAEVMQRTNTGSTSPREMLLMAPSVIKSRLAVLFYGTPVMGRVAWLIRSDEKGQFLVWFSPEREADNDEQGNVFPNHLLCNSAFYLQMNNALEAIENYVLKGELPENTMPPGHLQSPLG